MTYEPVDDYDNVKIKFSDLILYPPNIKNYTSENEGAEVLDIQYKPSESTLDYWYQLGEDFETKMHWSILKADPEYIMIKIDFTDETVVSTNSLD